MSSSLAFSKPSISTRPIPQRCAKWSGHAASYTAHVTLKVCSLKTNLCFETKKNYRLWNRETGLSLFFGIAKTLFPSHPLLIIKEGKWWWLAISEINISSLRSHLSRRKSFLIASKNSQKNIPEFRMCQLPKWANTKQTRLDKPKLNLRRKPI